ncbi:hypothetical protein [Marinisporobacter balticus]|uniref:DUF5666 domain-containing protein n=1 Tax=Marinisporobacter balticus TaxID=2018667 RepID=A0A4R2L417_9FIRM|nr:hypothetical protein [Marinisporobacter balticus]TCO78699.1 hypothetical protein EV214_10483 [Marinisporobacter balticus]
MKKIMRSILVFTLLLSMSVISSYAYGAKAFTPPGLAKKGGLPPGLVKKEQLPPGWDKGIGDINEYEEAHTIERNLLKGTVKEVGKNILKVQMNTMRITLEIVNDTEIKINGASGDLEDIQVGDEISVETDELKGIVEIDVTNENKGQFVTGKLLDIKNEDEIVLKVNDATNAYMLADDVKVYIQGRLKELEDLKENETIKLKLENNQVKIIRWNPEVLIEDTTFEGKIYVIDRDNEEIIVKNEATAKVFKLNKDTIIEIDGNKVELKDLEKGMMVEVFVEDDKKVKVLVQTTEHTYEGRLMKIESGLQNKITIEVDNETKTFVVDEDVEVQIDEGQEGFIALFDEIGHKVEIKVLDNQVVEIEVADK